MLATTYPFTVISKDLSDVQSVLAPDLQVIEVSVKAVTSHTTPSIMTEISSGVVPSGLKPDPINVISAPPAVVMTLSGI